MDIQAKPTNESNSTTESLGDRLLYVAILWVGRNRKWLPLWAKMLLLKMVRRKKGVNYMILLCETASRQKEQEQPAKATENLL